MYGGLSEWFKEQSLNLCNPAMDSRVRISRPPFFARVAQLVERRTCNSQAASAILAVGSI